MLADYHMHTSFSPDSQFDMEDEIRCAIKKGIREICFTDHVDHNIQAHQDCPLREYRLKYEECRSKYQDRIVLKWGAEFGVQTHTVSLFQKDFDDYDFDFILLSCHQIQDLEFWNQQFQKGKSQKEINEAYYQEIYQCMQLYKDYSVLGHLDAIKRDDPYGEYDDDQVEEILMAILKKTIADGKGIEVNTSCFRYHLFDLTPSKKILQMYHDLGGRILTFGSDTHKEEHVGFKIEEVKEIVREIGFKEFATFEKMKPIFHPL